MQSVSKVIFLIRKLDYWSGSDCNSNFIGFLFGVATSEHKEGVVWTRCVFCPEETGSEWLNVLLWFKKLRNCFNNRRNSFISKRSSASRYVSPFTYIFRKSQFVIFFQISKRKLGPNETFIICDKEFRDKEYSNFEW